MTLNANSIKGRPGVKKSVSKQKSREQTHTGSGGNLQGVGTFTIDKKLLPTTQLASTRTSDSVSVSETTESKTLG